MEEVAETVSAVLAWSASHWRLLSLLVALYAFFNYTALGRKIADAANAFADTYNEQYVEAEREEEEEGEPKAKAGEGKKGR